MEVVVIKGIFEKYSNGTWVDGVNLINFIEVDGKRYEKVVWTDHMANFVKPALGKPVTLSLGRASGHYLLGALECAGKIEKETDKSFAGYSQLALISRTVLAIILAGLAYKLAGEMFSYLIVFIGFPAWILFGKRARYNKLINALDGYVDPAPAITPN